MRLFSRVVELDVQDVHVGRLRLRVKENLVDRIIAWFDPVRAQKRLQARAALEGGPPLPTRKIGVVHPGYSLPPKEDLWGAARRDTGPALHDEWTRLGKPVPFSQFVRKRDTR